jgi:hypothetical protein
MATTIRFREHEEFQRAAVHMAIAGALAGLAGYVAFRAIPGFGPVGGAWALAALVVAAAFGAAAPARRTRPVELIVFAATGAGAGAALALGGETVATAALALGFGLLVARGGRRFLATLLVASATAILARFVLGNLLAAAADTHVPLGLAAAATGAAFAFVGVLGLLPRHLELHADRVGAAKEATRTLLTGEVRELADRAVALWNKVDQTLEPDAPVRRAVEDSVVRLFEIARRWAAIENDGARTSAELLGQRMAAVTEKLERTSDAVAREQYAQAHAALAEQLRTLGEIGTARERVVARLHHYIAAMERLRFAIIHHRSAEVQPILDELEGQGAEIDIASAALDDLARDRG